MMMMMMKVLMRMMKKIMFCGLREVNFLICRIGRIIFFLIILDVMHIEKNVCDNFLNTLLDVAKKKRDDETSREAIKKVGVKHHLWLKN